MQKPMYLIFKLLKYSMMYRSMSSSGFNLFGPANFKLSGGAVLRN
jgi:hypothetical protein